MTGLEMQIMNCMFYGMGRGKNHVTYMSINTLLKNLDKNYNKKIKRSWLFENIKKIIDKGWMGRKPLYRRTDSGRWQRIPSVYWFKIGGVWKLLKMGQDKALKLYKGLKSLWEKKDGRSLPRKDFDDGSWKPADPEERKRFDGLLGGVMNPIGQK